MIDMMKAEFEKIAGYEVSVEDYDNIIEPMYMATNLTKEEFVQTINKKRLALKPISAIKREMRRYADELRTTCDHYTDYETIEKLENLMDEYIARHGWPTSVHWMIEKSVTRSGCSYPATVIFFGADTFKTIETINLVA